MYSINRPGHRLDFSKYLKKSKRINYQRSILKALNEWEFS